MDSGLVSVGLPAALAIIMFGLGLALTTDDFRRIGRTPLPVGVALAAQLVVLPALCFGLVLALDLAPILAVGMMLLAASPGGTTANLFSHLFRGDVALNITLTAVNSLIAVVSLPLVVNLAVGWFDPPGAEDIGLQLGKTAQVFAIVLVPVALGMLVRHSSPGFAARADRPVRIASAVVLALVIVGALVGERENIADYIADVGIATTLFCALSLTVGYLLPRLLGIEQRQALASAFEVGIHNSTLAIAIALSVLDNDTLAVPAAVYGVVMFPLALLAGWLLTRRRPPARGHASGHRLPAL
ncbi:bile acid:sodium symporter family protein [Nocardioides carbamazepini]|uniref:bile acid:sodium symporter family protein n=1 Tax=Nocardioides carbamazepini TaxID=2854259 RepID=UPI002149A9C4|nr:bile acid:sodium symporter family protein [Nocardioides carbamazepini]MCR1784246.1 bile acid:sodium symporter family protein [Nocardioides carbamazepini]